MNGSTDADSFATQARGKAVPLVIGVTSHRNIPVRDEVATRRRIREFIVALQREFPALPIVMLSPLAEGGDQWAAEEALAAGARLIAPLPMARVQYADDFTGAVRSRFDALCAAAEVIEVPEATGAVSGTGDVPSGQDRDLHYAQAGIYVSEHCHILLAIWDGKASNLLGGTAQIAQYHLAGTRPSQTDRRRSAARGVLGADSERLVYHIVCSRDQADGAPAAPLQPLQTWWRTGSRALPGDALMPDEFRAAFQRAAEFNMDWAKYSARIAAHPGVTPDRQEAAGHSAIEAIYQAADWLAMHFQRRVLLAMRSLYTLAALMGIAFTVYDNLPAQDNMLYVFLLLFALGGFVVALANRRDWHRKYLDYRALAEGLRVQSYWQRAGLLLTGDAEFARDNFLQKQDVELGWVRNAMRSAELEDAARGRPHPSPQALPEVIRDWVGDDRHKGQLEYYQRKAAQRARTHGITETMGIASLCVGIGISIVLAAFASRLSSDAKNILVVVMAVFSIVAGVRAAYAYKKADKELIKQYRYMQRIFTEARSALDHAVDIGEQREILRMLGEAALAEQAEWALMQRQRPLEHNRI
jgi:hypothetical protein